MKFKFWTVEKESREEDVRDVTDEFWDSAYGVLMSAEKCQPVDNMLPRFLAHRYGAVVWSDRDYDYLRGWVLANWPEE